MSERHDEPSDPQAALRAARADAARRIAELRRASELPPAPAVPDLRSLLSRAEDHVSELRDTATELKAVLPTRVEAAVSRALAGSEGTSIGRQVEDLRRLALETSAAMGSLARDVRDDQVGRVEDLETMVDLIATSALAVRADVARVEAELAETRQALAGVAAGVAGIADAVGQLSAKLDRPLSMTLVPAAASISPGPAASNPIETTTSLAAASPGHAPVEIDPADQAGPTSDETLLDSGSETRSPELGWRAVDEARNRSG